MFYEQATKILHHLNPLDYFLSKLCPVLQAGWAHVVRRHCWVLDDWQFKWDRKQFPWIAWWQVEFIPKYPKEVECKDLVIKLLIPATWSVRVIPMTSRRILSQFLKKKTWNIAPHVSSIVEPFTLRDCLVRQVASCKSAFYWNTVMHASTYSRFSSLTISANSRNTSLSAIAVLEIGSL